MGITKPIVIIGSGGFGREVLTLLEDINSEGSQFEILGFVNSDRDEPEGSFVDGIPLLNRKILANPPKDLNGVIGIGFPAVKFQLWQQFRDSLFWPNLIHPTVVQSKRVRLAGKGIVITAGNILTTNIEIADQVMINLASTVGHDVRLGAFSVVSPSVSISGGVTVGTGANIGTGAVINPQIAVGEWSIVGAGTVVTREVPPNSTVVGVPGAVVKERSVGWQLAS